ncbi:MAG: polysaccharide deacetylase family protein, partial [Gallionellaceae bacterium]|nr:polysaccharide deacetylase family protein [Gallionellaceae bacterium]
MNTAVSLRKWRPAPFILASLSVHACALLLVLLAPAWWQWALGAVLLDHAVIIAASLWPRSPLLGANLVRLPSAAAQRGEVALTFDDGPDPQVTPQVLDILAQHQVRATFFCIGEKAVAHPDICRDIVARGHTIENHGRYHRIYAAFSGIGGWMREIGEAQEMLEYITGRRPQFFRAHAGMRNPFLDPVLHTHDLSLASWTRRGYDTRCRDADTVLSRLTRNLAAGDILLLHDGHAARTANGTPVVLEVL